MFLFPREREELDSIKDIQIAQRGPCAEHRERYTIIVSSKCGKLGSLQHLQVLAPSAF